MWSWMRMLMTQHLAAEYSYDKDKYDDNEADQSDL